MTTQARHRALFPDRTSWWRRLAIVVALALAAGFLQPAAAASADDDYEIPPYDPLLARSTAVYLMVDGSPSVRRAAEVALLGTDDDVKTFVEGGGIDEAMYADAKAAAQVLAGMDGPSVRSAALAAIAGSPDGLTPSSTAAGRQRWGRRAAAGLPADGVRRSDRARGGVRALAGTAEELTQFLSEGRKAAQLADTRLAATWMLNRRGEQQRPGAGHGGAEALAAPAELLREFLESGQFVARARDRSWPRSGA